MQPPSGGCVLKLKNWRQGIKCRTAATFGWLCVETFDEFINFDTGESSHLRVAVC